jgi:hypothetical protein
LEVRGAVADGVFDEGVCQGCIVSRLDIVLVST